jgi:hypothetical protein
MIKKSEESIWLKKNKDLERVNYHLQEIICVLKDELLNKDQTIRRIKADRFSGGILERNLIKTMEFFGKMRIRIKKMLGLY